MNGYGSGSGSGHGYGDETAPQPSTEGVTS